LTQEKVNTKELLTELDKEANKISRRKEKLEKARTILDIGIIPSIIFWILAEFWLALRPKQENPA